MRSVIVKLWNTKTSAIASNEADLTETWCILQSSERDFMYFAGKMMYLIVPSSVHFSIRWSENDVLRVFLGASGFFFKALYREILTYAHYVIYRLTRKIFKNPDVKKLKDSL